MRPFRFRLQKVLEIREQESNLAQQALAEAQFHTLQAARARDEAQARRATSETQLLAQRMHRMTALEWQLSAQMHEALIQQEERAEDDLATALAHETERHQELVEAERRKKVLDRLRDRRAEEHRLVMEALEQAQIDEMAQNIFREGGDRR